MRPVPSAILALCAILLASCGNKGALVMPPAKPQSAPEQAPTPPSKDASAKPGSSS